MYSLPLYCALALFIYIQPYVPLCFNTIFESAMLKFFQYEPRLDRLNNTVALILSVALLTITIHYQRSTQSDLMSQPTIGSNQVFTRLYRTL